MPEDNSNTAGKAVGENAKYRIGVPASTRDGMPEGLARVLDILQQNIPPQPHEHTQPATENPSMVEPEPD